FTLLLTFVAFGFLAVLPFLVYRWAATYLEQGGLGELFWFVVVLYFIFWWLGLFYRLMIYLLDVWLVTDHRVIDSRQIGFFNRVVAEARLNRVQDVTTHVSGFFETLLNFGQVEVQTAGTEQRISFKQVPNPNVIKEAILKANSEFVRMHPDGTESSL
ncbi:MAG: PH domain-containing protein, partial [Patescibacteria group bacterium]